MTIPWIQHSHGITTLDAGYVRPGFASIHLLERDGRVGLVDTGVNRSVPQILRAISQLGLQKQAVDWLFLTHVHLDHAGGVGLLAEQLPQAEVVVHPRGAPHLVDPSRLQKATIAVYGERSFATLYGELRAVPQHRIIETLDGDQLRLGSSKLSILHTPGHALHHQVLYDRDARAVFTGDTFGLSYRELDTNAGAFMVPTTTPSQFDPEQLLASIARIVELEAESVYLTHFGRVEAVARAARSLTEQIESFRAIALEHVAHEQREQRIRARLREYLIQRAEAHGIGEAVATVDRVLSADLDLNAQGLVAWLARAEKSAGRPHN